jgi:hypothetical protein
MSGSPSTTVPPSPTTPSYHRCIGGLHFSAADRAGSCLILDVHSGTDDRGDPLAQQRLCRDANLFGRDPVLSRRHVHAAATTSTIDYCGHLAGVVPLWDALLRFNGCAPPLTLDAAVSFTDPILGADVHDWAGVYDGDLPSDDNIRPGAHHRRCGSSRGTQAADGIFYGAPRVPFSTAPRSRGTSAHYHLRTVLRSPSRMAPARVLIPHVSTSWSSQHTMALRIP